MKRKLLAMVLSMAMTLSLGTFAANAASTSYSDAADIEFDEAAAVLTAAGVFSGTGDGSFQPKVELDRASAAKIITYLSVGAVAAEKMEAGEAPFYDVPANHWAAGYIAYCKNSGIIAGDGSGNFNPSAPVNASQFAKMLLVVLGYDADIEILVGANWAINVSKLASKDGILDEVSDSIGGTLTRDVAAKMAFNSLLADCVEYASKGDKLDLGGGQSFTFGASPATQQVNPKHDYRLAKGDVPSGSTTSGRVEADGSDSIMQLGEKLFGESLKKVSDGIEDGMKRPGYEWSWNQKKIFTGYEEATLTYASDLSALDDMKVVVSDLKARGVDVTTDYTDSENPVITLADGAEFYVNGEAVLGEEKTTDLAEILGYTNGAGKRAEFFVKNGKLEKVCVTVYTVAEVTAAEKYVESNGAEYIEYTLEDVEGSDDMTEFFTDLPVGNDGTVTVKVYSKVVAAEEDTGVIPNGMAEGDIVTYVKTTDDNGDMTYVYATTKMTGVQTSNNGKRSTIGGQNYNWGKGVFGFNSELAGKNDSKQERDFYIDVNGYLVKISDVESSDSYAIITGIVKDGLSDTARATLVFMDGTSKTVDVASLKTNKEGDNIVSNKLAEDADESQASAYFDNSVLAETADLNAGYKNIFVSYSVDSKGAYKLTALDGDKADTSSNLLLGGRVVVADTSAIDKDFAIVEKGKADVNLDGISGKIGNSTKVIIKNKDGDITVYTGNANMPTVKTSNKDDAAVDVTVTALIDLDKDNAPKSALNTLWININKDVSVDDSSSNKEYAIFYKDLEEYTAIGDDDVVIYQVGSDAKVKTINLADDQEKHEAYGLVYLLKSVNSNGVVTEIEEVKADDKIAVGTNGVTSMGEGFIELEGVTYTYDDSTVVTLANLNTKSVSKGNLDTIKDECVKTIYIFHDEKKAEKVFIGYDKDFVPAAE